MNILIKFIFNYFFSLIIDSLAFIYFLFFRGYKGVYTFIIIYFIYYKLKSKKYT